MNTKPRFVAWFGWAALLVAWAVDLLFWQKAPGVNFVLWVVLGLTAGFLLAWREGVKPSRWTWVPAALALAFALVTFWRLESFTRFLGVALGLACLVLTAATFRTGNWVAYRTWDFVMAALGVFGAALSRPVQLWAAKPDAAPTEDGKDEAETARAKPSWFKRSLPVLRGLLLALPLVFVLGALLASADPIFSDQLSNFFKLFNLEKLPEYLVRLVYVLILAYLMLGVYLQAVLPAHLEPRPDPQTPALTRFLGWTETAVVLVSVDTLFAFFVAIQSLYLFGGRANITATGYTYADYARRGFFELVVVAAISLLLYLCLNAVTRRETDGQRRGFSGLSLALMALVLVILASSLQRLLMYVDAYGFSQLRTYTLVCIVWMALLFLTAIALEVTRRSGHLPLAVVLTVVGFALSLAALNVDGFIVHQNVSRAKAGSELDSSYLSSLSLDAVPALFEEYQAPDLPQPVRSELGATLACKAAFESKAESQSWLSFHLGQSQGRTILKEQAAAWSRYSTSLKDGQWQVQIDGQSRPCLDTSFMD